MSKKIHVTTTVNGEGHEFLCEARESLLEVLRDRLGLTGSKEGCNNGNCGACSVLMDGVPVDSCLVLAVEAEGASITTIEGMAGDDGSLHPMQQAFMENHGLQCGYCTPGMVMAATSLLAESPNPTEEEVRLSAAPAGAKDLSASWSFDGERIVHSRARRGPSELVLLDLTSAALANPLELDERARALAFFCLDLDGNVQWTERGLGQGTLIVSDGRLLILSGDGEFVVARATPDGYEELDRVKVFEDGKCWTTPVLADGRIYLRNSVGTLVCRDHRSGAVEN